MEPVVIAIDAMGGDHGPSVIVPAALEALKRHPHLSLILVGLKEALPKAEKGKRLEIVHAPETIEMHEAPATALRTKKHSSMRIALNLVKEHKAQACLSAGNTGALMAIARFVLKMLPGVERPAIIYALPCDGPFGESRFVRVLDLGANVDCSPEHLLQFAVMGSVFSKAVDEVARPRVALLNIGSEAIKGSEVVKRASELLSRCPGLHYTGFVEGTDMYMGAAEVVVCDGFVGNIALKSSEGVARMILDALKREFNRSLYGKCVGLLAKPLFARVRQRLDPNVHNGGTLLGLRGVVLKSHGSAREEGFVRAIEQAMLVASQEVPSLIQAEVSSALVTS